MTNTPDRKNMTNEDEKKPQEKQQKDQREEERRPSDAMARLQKGIKFTSDEDIVKPKKTA